MNEYENLLDRAIDQLPPEVFESKRFEPVKAYSVIQGNRTFIQNFKDVADSLNKRAINMGILWYLHIENQNLKIIWKYLRKNLSHMK